MYKKNKEKEKSTCAITDSWYAGHPRTMQNCVNICLNNFQESLWKGNLPPKRLWKCPAGPLPLTLLSLFSCSVVSDIFTTSMDCSPPGSCPWNFPDKNTGVGCRVLLQGNLPDPIQGLNSHLLHWQADSLTVSQQGSPATDLGGCYFFLARFCAGVSEKQWRLL